MFEANLQLASRNSEIPESLNQKRVVSGGISHFVILIVSFAITGNHRERIINANKTL